MPPQPSPWDDADTIIGFDDGDRRSHVVCHLDRLRIRYFARWLKPRPAEAAPVEAATDFAVLDGG